MIDSIPTILGALWTCCLELSKSSKVEIWTSGLLATFSIWAVGYLACAYGRLTDRLYGRSHPLFWLAGMLGGGTVYGMFALKYAKIPALLIIANWAATEVVHDAEWQTRLFATTFDQVSSLRNDKGEALEPTTTMPHPKDGGAGVPVTTPAAKQSAAEMYASALPAHFRLRHSFLGHIVTVDESALSNRMLSTLNNDLADVGDKGVGSASLVSSCAGMAAAEMSGQTDVVVTRSRLAWGVTALVAFAVMALVIWLVGLWRIKIRRARDHRPSTVGQAA